MASTTRRWFPWFWAAAFAVLSCGSGSAVQQGPRASLTAYADALADGRADEAYAMLSSDAKRSISLEAYRRMVKENSSDVEDITRALRRTGSDPLVTATVRAPNGEQLTLVYEDGRWLVDGTGIDRYGQATPRQALKGFLRAFQRKRYDIIMRYVPDAELAGPSASDWATAPPSEPDEAPAGSTSSPEQAPSAAGGPMPAAATAAAPPKTASAANSGTGLTAQKLRAAWEGEQKAYISRIVQAIQSALPTARIEETDDRAAMPYGAGGTVLFVRESGLWKIEDLK